MENNTKQLIVLSGVMALFLYYTVTGNPNYAWVPELLLYVGITAGMFKFNDFLVKQNLSEKATTKDLMVFFVGQVVMFFVISFVVSVTLSVILELNGVIDKVTINILGAGFFGMLIAFHSILSLFQVKKVNGI